MPLTAQSSARRRRKNADEKLPERLGESSAAVMAPTRMKLRVRRRDDSAGGAGHGQPEEGEHRGRESVGRSSRRKNINTSSTAAATSASSRPSSSASASARAVMAAEEVSPDSKCPICLDRFNNLAYLERCLHRFCFPCIQEWSHNKPECPLCKQPFTSILHSVRAEDDFKEYTLRPTPANSSVAATVAMVAAMASAARSDPQMRLTLRRHRGEDGRETTTRRRRRERGGREGGSTRAGERTGVLEWYLDSHPPPHAPVSPVGTEESDEGEHLAQQSLRGGADLAERGVIFEGLTGLGGAVAPVAPNDRASRRLMSRLAARQRQQREGGTVRRLREREMVAFRRALYRCGIRVRGVAGVNGSQVQQRDITAETFRESPAHLNRLRPWLRRELTVLYGAHGVLVHIVQRIIMARLAHHGLEDTPTIQEELRPFLLARTEHFLHELVSFARSPLSLDNYDLQAVYEPPAASLDLEGFNSSSDSSSIIAISEGEEEERQTGERSEEILQGRAVGAHDDIIQSGSCLSLSAWDDETPGPSYSTAEPSCSLASLSFSPAPQEGTSEGGGEKRNEGEAEEECLIVGYKKPIAERTPELVQLSSDTEEDEEEKKKEDEKVADMLPPPLPSTTPPLCYLPTVPPSTSGAYRDEQDDKPKEKDSEADGCDSRARSWSGSSGKSRESVFTLSPCEEQQDSWRYRKQSGSEVAREKRKKRKRRRGRERTSDWLRKSGTMYNPNRSIYPAMMRHHSRSPLPFHSSGESGSPLPPSPPDSRWEYNYSPLTSSVSSPSHTSSFSSSPQPSPPPQTPPTPSQSPSNPHHGEKPGGKRKYKSRHLDRNDKDPTWRPMSSHCREKRRKRGEKERRKRNGRGGGSRRERDRRDGHREGDDYVGESSRKRCREDRSPSVEIIYEGTITSDPTQPPACKRRRKRHRRMQHSSSPVIITLDSDSSHEDVNNKHMNSTSSSPLSSQQTIDFSDLPPLPLTHSASVGKALDAEIGELPVDILDQGSDGSETEPAGPSETARPIAIDNSDNSDREVDVENVEEIRSLLGCSDTDKGLSSNIHGPVKWVDTNAATCDYQRKAATVDVDSAPTGENVADLITTDVRKRESEVLTSDSRLLATILNDLDGITAPKCDHSLNFEPSLLKTRKKKINNLCEVNQSLSNQGSWLPETRHVSLRLPEEQQSNDVGDQNQGLDLPTRATTMPLECGVREEGGDVLTLVKRASPVQLYRRNMPPPLKHKDSRSSRQSPLSSVDLHSSHTSDTVCENFPVVHNSNSTDSPVDSHLAAELSKDNQAIPPITALKEPFTSTPAVRKELASTSNISVIDMQPSCNLATTDSHSASPYQVRALTTSSYSSHMSPSHSHPSVSENSSTNSDIKSSKFHSSHDGSKKTLSGSIRLSTDMHPVNSLSPVDFHSAKTGRSTEKPAHIDSTSRGFRNKTLLGQNTSRVLPIDLHSCSSVSAERTLTGSGIFSGVKSNDTSPPASVSPLHFKTHKSYSPIDSHFSNESQNLSEKFRVSSVPTTASSSRFSSVDLHPRNAKSVCLHSSSAVLEELTNSKVSLIVSHENRLTRGHQTPTDLHFTSPVPPANLHSSSFISSNIGRHFNHTALSSSPTEHTITLQTSHRKCTSQSKPTNESPLKHLHFTDSDSGPGNHFDPRPVLRLPIDTCSKPNVPIDSQPPTDFHPVNTPKDIQLHTSNHITSPPRSVEKRWNSNSFIDAHANFQSPSDERSASSIWTPYTLPHRTDK